MKKKVNIILWITVLLVAIKAGYESAKENGLFDKDEPEAVGAVEKED